ncbi:GNAT family N-acetyltransferase [soil metagenome]
MANQKPNVLPEIRLVGPQEVDLIQELAASAWWVTYGGFIAQEQLDYMFGQIYQPQALLRQMQEEGQTFLLLQVEGAPAGFASYSLKDPAERVYKLNKIYLQPEQQQKVLGKVLLQAVEAQVCGRQGRLLDLNVNRYNPARSFYERCGYTILHEEDLPIGPYWMNDYVMRKKLNC